MQPERIISLDDIVELSDKSMEQEQGGGLITTNAIVFGAIYIWHKYIK